MTPMEPSVLFLGLLNMGVGVVALLLSIPLVLGKVQMNTVYGVRVTSAFESKERWGRINRYGGRQLMIGGLALTLIGMMILLLPSVGVEVPLEAIMVLAFAPLLLLIPAWRTVAYAKRT